MQIQLTRLYLLGYGINLASGHFQLFFDLNTEVLLR
jgi:hypothetical protein